MNIEIRNGYLIFPREDRILIEKKNIYIHKGIIKYNKTFSKTDRVIDVKNRVIFPGLVNAHHHIYSCLSKGIPVKTPFKNFEGILKNLWWKLDKALLEEDVTLSTVLTLQDCIRNGVTTIFDHHISTNFVENSLNTLAEVFENFGLNGALCFEISNRNGNEIFQKSLKENIRFIKKKKPNSLKGMIGLHASFTLDNENLKEIKDKTENFPIHIHIAEDKIDEIQCKEKYNQTVIERLENFDLLRQNSLLVHCSNIANNEIEILKNEKLFIVQTIDSNMNNALNIANISKLIKNGIKTTVGTDGMSSNILKSFKNSFLFTKYQNQDPDIGFFEMKAMLLNSYKLKKAFGFPIGVLEDEPADIVIFDYKPATPLNENTFISHFIYGITESQAQWVIKKGKILLDNFKLQITNQYDDLIDNATRITKKMFKRFTKSGKI
ncbi:MAG: amidohydrolase family protein [Candidatus Cloacimonetes bacterium]|nr:amidohydrolase family protein [Candidatus Cloacimonadota bacterium]